MISKIRRYLPGTLVVALVPFVHAESAAVVEAVTPPIAVEAAPIDEAQVAADSSYALGYRTGTNFGREFGRFGVGVDDLDKETFLKGFLTGMAGKPTEVEEARLQAAMGALGDRLQAREKKIAEANLAEGKKFLEENAKREGVVTTESGLQYEVLKAGEGKGYVAPEGENAPEKQFMVNYKGTLIDGREFDASEEGQPTAMSLQVIDGFREALTMMPMGAKWKLFIPSELAYGEERQGALIPPNSTLSFDMELVSIQDAPPQQGGFPFPIPEQ